MCVIIDFISVKLFKDKIALLHHALVPNLLSWSPQKTSHLLFPRGLSPVRMLATSCQYSPFPGSTVLRPVCPAKLQSTATYMASFPHLLHTGCLQMLGTKPRKPRTPTFSWFCWALSAAWQHHVPYLPQPVTSVMSDLLHNPSTTSSLAVFRLNPQHWCLYVGFPWSPLAVVPNDCH